MKTTNESYQNLTKQELDTQISKIIRKKIRLIRLNNYSYFLNKVKKISIFKYFENSKLIDKRYYSLDSLEKTLKNYRIEQETQTQTQISTSIEKDNFIEQLENEILSTPTNEPELNNIKTQLNQIIKKRTRSTTTFNFCLLLHTVKKISTDKLVSIGTKRKEKTDLLKRVHTLLVFEHNRLNKVA